MVNIPLAYPHEHFSVTDAALIIAEKSFGYASRWSLIVRRILCLCIFM